MKLGDYGKVSCQSPWTIEESSSSTSCEESDQRLKLSLDLLFALPEGPEDCGGNTSSSPPLWVTFALPAACETVSLSFSANSRFLELYDRESVYLKTFRGTVSASSADLFQHRLDASLRGAFTLKLVSVKPAGCRVCFFVGMEMDILLQPSAPPPAAPAAPLPTAPLPAPHQEGTAPTAFPLTAAPPPSLPPAAAAFADGPRQWLALDFSHAALSRLLDSKLGPLYSRIDSLERSVSSLALIIQQQQAQQQHLLLLHQQNLQLKQQLQEQWQQHLQLLEEQEQKEREGEKVVVEEEEAIGGREEGREKEVQEVVEHLVDILATEEKKKKKEEEEEVALDDDGGDGEGGGGGDSDLVDAQSSN